MQATANTNEQHASQVMFHQGRALLQIASTYPTVLEIIMEQVQNALDANATKIGMILNQKTRRITVTDNGDGVTVEDFNTALGQVCSSVKRAGKLGRFGIGLVSPLGKCDSFTFTSNPKGVQQGYVEWTFNTDLISRQKESVEVPHKRLTNLAFKANVPGTGGERSGAMTLVPWRTRVAIVGYSTDKLISRITSLDSLVENIFERFGASMRKNKATLSVRFVNERGVEEVRENLRPVQFSGKKLAGFQFFDEKAGFVTFDLYMARKTTKGYQGKVMLGEADNDYRFPFTSFARSGREYLPQEIIDALSSGIFEGEILSSGATLHSNRKNFERNEAFMGVCVAIETWFKERGKEYLAQVKEASEEERYQNLGLRSLAMLEEMLKNPRFKGLRDIIHGFKRGTIGDGHTEPDEGGVLGVQQEPSLSTDSLDLETGEGEGKLHRTPEKEKDHAPFTVTGPRGHQRSIVKNGSLGLQFSHVAMEGSERLYELDAKVGVLHFNIRHPLWVSCEESDRQVMQLQEFIALKALTHLVMPHDWKDIAETAYDELNEPFVYLLQNSGAFRLGVRPKASTE